MGFTEEQRRQRAFYRVAFVMFGMWEEKRSSDTRLLLPPLIPDRFVLVGESIKGAECREHVVPRNVICYRCHDMFEEGKSIENVSQFIRTYLKIVRISKLERRTLDAGNKLNLRQRMPDGWTFESVDIYARLNAANITIRFYEDADT